jgi:hypothetical protein
MVTLGAFNAEDLKAPNIAAGKMATRSRCCNSVEAVHKVFVGRVINEIPASTSVDSVFNCLYPCLSEQSPSGFDWNNPQLQTGIRTRDSAPLE